MTKPVFTISHNNPPELTEILRINADGTHVWGATDPASVRKALNSMLAMTIGGVSAAQRFKIIEEAQAMLEAKRDD